MDVWMDARDGKPDLIWHEINDEPTPGLFLYPENKYLGEKLNVTGNDVRPYDGHNELLFQERRKKIQFNY